ncbi:nickel pincer cofactor biosynthesis protein LarB [Geobacter sulfurreducens]|uniref:Phosphoribosylaminoimidazole carboxylase-related protein n=1 Tax=Geobacter sulfurreducens (strain ATCC 51573 / DSM 12127 / PCA) TaxID=243231 RepID=Q74GV4_GEOSL|nr:nickel pincer cofactor biosynthesis protein LarB [Geobacter sulfurreducens]AAR33475.1 phosphoribosylaminoimidazole carboxylase-related protein [Geobacter sulfurreducens PCA]ADI82979.1 phosphoribosylaminoimidazole carboxylase-related protein [Geobacter sulfurreducens KN400]AJY71911.1 1-(5-phosphoribosyl)-5-amino-4-imidazole-carboxylate carboxylase [Geobacter sulfurreducens]QVW35418.1 nickel pincer cofactor biosynthesis protein LarB [Geobacter sulfurreducens]UAC04241.1 nickel pincer cofactor 
MDPRELKTILRSFKDGALSEDEMLERLRHLPYEDVGDALVDHHRGLRQGFPEVIFGAGKSAGQVERIMASLAAKGNNILVTRLDEAKALAVKEAFPSAMWHADARCLTLEQRPIEKRGLGTVLVLSAGTSDLPVAAEALVTLRMLGNEASHLYDVGVAGIHRLLARRDVLFSARVLIVVAGMEGALPSVVGGLVDRPVIAVPTSVGYGASFGGIAALLGMLNSCAAGVTVVNIDNGFGAAVAASKINRE